MKKAICILAAVSVLLGLSSCNKGALNLSEIRTVSEESEWWNEESTVISPDEVENLTGMDAWSISSSYYAADEDSVVLSFAVYDKSLGYTDLLMHYSYDGRVLGKVDLNNYFGETLYTSPNAIYKQSDKYFAIIEHYDVQKEVFIKMRYEVDFDAGTLKEPSDVKLPDNGYIIGIAGVEDKLVYLMYSPGTANPVYKVCIDDGRNPSVHGINLGKGLEIQNISGFNKNGGGVSFVANVTENGKDKYLYCTLDLTSFAVEQVELDRYSGWNTYIVPDCGAFYVSESFLISKLDTDTSEMKKYLDLADTYLLGENAYPEVLWATETSAVIYCQDTLNGNSTTYLIKLDKASKNPNAGKKILSLAYLDWMGTEEHHAVNDFNRKSDKYFIEVDNKYYDIANGIYKTEGWEYNIADVISSESIAVDTLKADIREGKGPDILLYGSEAAQLNSTDYLVDLTKRIDSEKSLKGGDYMDLVTNPNGRDGKHYRLDYGFTSSAFIINNNLIDEGTKGLTFDKYDQIVKEKNEGKSVLYEENLALMKLMLKTSDSLSYDKEGKLKLGNESFKGLSDYIASIPDNMIYDEDYETFATRMHIEGTLTFQNFVFSHGKTYKYLSIVGLPSYDGHPEAVNGRGIGITSCCPMEDAAWEFAMTLMSSDFQQMMQIHYDPVLKSAQKTMFTDFINMKNDTKDPSDSEISLKIVDYYIEQISDAVVYPDIDSSIIVIMNEEMPAYFEGQKSFDEVTKIISNRVNLMLSEQG